MKPQLFFFLILLYAPCQAQVVKTIQKSGLNPVENVFIYNEDSTRSTETNSRGRADISGFDSNDILTFQHSSYHLASFSKSELEENNFIVHLADRIIEIDEVVVSANRWAQEKREIPHTIQRISPNDIYHKNPQTLADALHQSGGVFMQKSQLGGGSPMIRGFAANSVLITVDGVRMNNAIFRSGNLQNVILIDPNSLKNAEIIYGPGAVMYGSDALGGTMNFYTQQPEYASGGTRFNGHAFTRYATANNEKTGHIQFNLSGNKIAGFTSVTYSDFDDLRAGSDRDDRFPDFGKRFNYVRRINGKDSVVANDNYNIQRFSGYSQFNLTQKIRYALSDNTDLTYGLFYTTGSDVPRYDRLIEQNDGGAPVYAEWYYGPQEWMMQYMSADLKNGRFFSNGKLTAAYQRVKESRHNRRMHGEDLRSQIEKVDVFSVNADFQKTFPQESKLFFGGEATYNYVNSEAFRRNLISGDRLRQGIRPAGATTLRRRPTCRISSEGEKTGCSTEVFAIREPG